MRRGQSGAPLAVWTPASWTVFDLFKIFFTRQTTLFTLYSFIHFISGFSLVAVSVVQPSDALFTGSNRS